MATMNRNRLVHLSERHFHYLTRSPLELQTLGTAVILLGSLLTYLTIPNDDALTVFRHDAYFFGVTLALAISIELVSGAKALIRPDIIALFTLYFLTFAEFLSPHVMVLVSVSGESAFPATALVFLGFSGLAIGRHFVLFGRRLKAI